MYIVRDKKQRLVRFSLSLCRCKFMKPQNALREGQARSVLTILGKGEYCEIGRVTAARNEGLVCLPDLLPRKPCCLPRAQIWDAPESAEACPALGLLPLVLFHMGPVVFQAFHAHS